MSAGRALTAPSSWASRRPSAAHTPPSCARTAAERFRPTTTRPPVGPGAAPSALHQISTRAAPPHRRVARPRAQAPAPPRTHSGATPAQPRARAAGGADAQFLQKRALAERLRERRHVRAVDAPAVHTHRHARARTHTHTHTYRSL